LKASWVSAPAFMWHSSTKCMKKILVIDDDKDMIAIARLALAGKYCIESWPDGRELPELAREFRPDLIIVDYFIGTQTAAGIIALLKTDTQNENIPFILFSGHHDIRRLAGEIGACSFLEKPFSISALHRCIEEAFTQQACS
jgi:DNA-binding NtrC family response regulator